MTAPTGLRVEHLDEAMGIATRHPRLSWRLPAGARRQRAYRIRSEEWDSGRVESDGSVLVPYGGRELRSRQRVTWQVKLWTDAGETDWSAPAWWEMGLLQAEDWTARWVAPAEDPDPRPPGHRPAYLLRSRFPLAHPTVRARLYATAHGVYEAFLNGRRVGGMELTPGFTSYRTNLCVQAFDVTGLLVEGTNTLAAVLSDGWFRGQLGYFRSAGVYGASLALLAQLHLEHQDGTETVVATGPQWRSATGPVLAADLMEGETVDLRRAQLGWCAPEYQDDHWSPVTVEHHDLARLTGSPAPPVRRVQELRPVRVTRPLPDRQVVDLGQNVNGWLRLSNLGPAGTTTTLTHGEALGPDGDVTTEHLRAVDLATGRKLPAGQVDRVTSAGRPGEVFEPRHTTHGFRFVRVEGHAEDLTAADVTGVVVHTDLRRTGWFECSDERVNRLHEAAVWSFRGNACDIPTDCPHRERAGWTGDWQLFVPTAAFLYDVAGFSTKWLRDLAADQWPDGRVANVVPDPGGPAGPDGPYAFVNGSAGWGDAAVLVPWEIWRAYGDRRLLAEQWPSMVAWVDFQQRTAREARHPSRVARGADPAPHERYLWDSGFHWGEWLEPRGSDSPSGIEALRTHDHGAVATAYFHRSASLLGRIARILGRDGEAARYEALAAAVRAAWQAEFIGPDGSLAPATQANHVRALAFDLVPDELRARTADRLVGLVRKAGTHLGTGFLATPYLLPVLADAGHVDTAYELLLQDTPPSWLAMVDRGATTVWELWEGLDEHGAAVASLNHYSKGAVVSFLHRYTAGIRLLDGIAAYRRFVVEPVPGGGIAWAAGAHESPYGRIETSWRIEEDRLRLTVDVPPGTTAQVRLPDGRRIDAGPGTSSYRSAVTRTG